MKHSFVDQYSGGDTFLHKLDPRTKFIATIAFILVVVSTPPTLWQAFAAYFALMALLLLVSRTPVLYVLKRSLVIIPFVLVVAAFVPFFPQGEVAGSYNVWIWHLSVTNHGLMVLWNVAIKAWLAVLSTILLSATTPLTDLLKGLEQLRFPRLMTMTLSFMYRYIFVLEDEVMRMRRARESRNFGGGKLRRIKSVGNMIGVLFIRSYERGERIYVAMLSRSFDGQARTLTELRLRTADVLFAALILCLLGTIRAMPLFTQLA